MKIGDKLRYEVKLYNSIGPTEVRRKAKEIYDKIIDFSFDLAREGKSKIEFDDTVLPRECVVYFKILCEQDGIKFIEKERELEEERFFNGLPNGYNYCIDWSEED